MFTPAVFRFFEKPQKKKPSEIRIFMQTAKTCIEFTTAALTKVSGSCDKIESL